MSRQSSRKAARRPLTREQLLPLPAAKARALSLEQHLALAALRQGHGGVEQVAMLLRVVYLAYFMGHAVREPVDLELLRAAESALECCSQDEEQEGSWTLGAQECDLIAQVLVLHDRQLAWLPAFRYTGAWIRIQAFTQSAALSPLPPA
ncbi:hypothetical protein [Paraburkholderia kururiensis]|jgi:hypothetical protein|uniref:hypothetical protein n=1 Tax=Paraburkholderia kururiensis TaxID=984307 RepID=UPI0018F77C56|nr:hypothetical protein [Paraburkholderia kururiensis]